jgi:hypothetical protein
MTSKFFNLFIIFLALFLFGACNDASDGVEDFLGVADNNESLSRIRAEMLPECFHIENLRQNFGIFCNEKTPQVFAVNNAGIVLAGNYIQILFDRLGLTRNGQFVDKESKIRAVLMLNYLGTSVSNYGYYGESDLLSKILSGLDKDEDINFLEPYLEPSEAEKNIIDSLIRAMISHWPIIGDSSINGFRGNWLTRPGYLYETENSWELAVGPQPYDVLIHKSPFSFSILHYPWMKKPLYVKWAY